jgi:hypothetical protein
MFVMKFTHHPLFLRSILAAALVIGSVGTVSAHYTHDSKGWYDENHHRHSFVTHNGHKGYWDKNDSGIWAFIRI